MEGVRLIEELLASPLEPLEFFFSDGLKKGKNLLPLLEKKGAKGLAMTHDVMAYASDLETAPGLIVLAQRPLPRWEEALKGASPGAEGTAKADPAPLVVVLDGAQTPANAGAVVRAAEAAGAHAVLQSTGGADLLGPKALRASAGSAFRLSLGGGRTAAAWAEDLSARGLSCVAADARGESLHTDVDWTRPTALFLGGETGFSADALPISTKVRIPLKPPVESLNVAVAAGVLLFEAARRRALR